MLQDTYLFAIPRHANISSKWLNHAIYALSFTFSIKINIVVQWYRTSVCLQGYGIQNVIYMRGYTGHYFRLNRVTFLSFKK